MLRQWAVLSCLLLSWAVPAAAAPPQVTLSASVPVEPSPALIPAFGSTPAVASDGQGMLLTYLDGYRFDVGTLFAQHLDANGTPLGLPFVLAENLRIDDLQIVFDGTDYVVSWVELAGNESLWYYRRISPDGMLGAPQLIDKYQSIVRTRLCAGDSGVLLLSCQDVCQTHLLVGDAIVAGDEWLGEQYGVYNVALAHADGVWQAAIERDEISLVQFDSDGFVIAGTEHALGSTGSEGYPRLATTPFGFALAWADLAKVGLAKVDSTGVPTIAGPPIEVTDHTLFPMGFQIDGDDIVLVTSEHWEPNCSGSGCPPTSSTTLRRLDPDLKVLPSLLTLDPGDVAFTGQGPPDFVVVASAAVEGAPLTTSDPLTIGEMTTLAETAPEMTTPRAALGPKGWLVAWTERPPPVATGKPRIRGALVTADASPTNKAFTLENRGYLYDLAAGTNGWLLAAGDPTEIGGPTYEPLFRVDENLELQLVSTWTGLVSLAASPQGFLVVTRSVFDDLVAMRLDVNAEPEMSFELADLGYASANMAPPLAAGFDGKDYVVTWADAAGQVSSKRIPLHGSPDAGTPEVLFTVPWPSRLDTAFQGTARWSLLDCSQGTYFAADSNRQKVGDYTSGGLTAFDGHALVALQRWSFGLDRWYEDGYSLSVAGPGEQPIPVATRDTEVQARLSNVYDNHALVAALVTDSSWGSSVPRLVTSVVTLEATGGEGGAGGSPIADAGGAGGASGSPLGDGGNGGTFDSEGGGGGSAGAIPSPDNGGEPNSSGGSASVSGGSPNQAGQAGTDTFPTEGGSDQAPGNGEGGEMLPHRPRTSSSCGCRAPGGRVPPPDPWQVTLLCAALAFSRRVRKRA